MRALKGHQIMRALRIARVSVWTLVLLLAALTAWQLSAAVKLAGGVQEGPPELSSAHRPGQRAADQEGLPPLEEYAVIWEVMDPPRPTPPPEPEPEPEPEPPPPPQPDPYPGMRLLGTILDDAGSYALIEIRPGQTEMLKEGASFEEIRLVEVREREATVELPDGTKTLRIEERSALGPLR